MALSPVRLRASMSVGSADTIAFTRSNSPALIASMKAALLEVVSGMIRFYRLRIQEITALVFVLLTTPAHAQSNHSPGTPAPPALSTPRAPSDSPAPPAPPALPSPPALGTTIPAEALDDLPASGNLLSLIDAVSADVISDRVDTGGLATGTAARMGGHASSWTQTRFLLDGVDITDNDGSGTPLLVPGVLEWERVDVITGAMPIGVNAAGFAVSLKPRRPTTEWIRRVEGFGAPPAFVSDPFLKTAPTISRLNSYANGSFLASGPILPDRLGIVVAGSWIASSRFDRTDPTELDSTRGSLFAHLVFTPGPRDELRVIGWGQHTTSPYENRTQVGQPTAGETDNAVHGQATWDRRISGDRLTSGFASYSIRQRTFNLRPVSSVVIDDVVDPPVSSLLYPGPGTDTAWTVGATLKPTGASASGMAALQLGAEVSGASADMQPAFSSATIGEAVAGLPARVWSFSSPGVPSHWSDTTVAVYASDRMVILPRLTADLGLRFETVNGIRTRQRRQHQLAQLPAAGGTALVDDRLVADRVLRELQPHRVPPSAHGARVG